MQFEFEPWQRAKLSDVIVLSQKNRQPDEDPGAKLSFEAQVSSDWLSCLDGHLKATMFCKHGAQAPNAQQSIEGVAPVSDLPNLTAIGQQCGTLHWAQKLEGYTMAIQYGTGRRESNIESDSCKVSNLRIEFIEGGTCNVKWSVEAPNVSEAHFGKLAKLKSREVDVSVIPPDPSAQRDLEDQEDELAGKGRKRREREGAEAKK